MKKSMIFVGMLAIGYANAQEYDGKVGINTDKPKATLDITPEVNNLTGTTNEGIIAPRLSKTRIANIEASKLTEGTLVYATDDATSPISAYAGTDTKVAKITEKGYYFYNGTEWVKAGVGKNDQLWATRPNGEDPSITETYLKSADEVGEIFRYRKGAIDFLGKQENSTEAKTSISAYGLDIHRTNKDGYGPYLSFKSGKGTLDAVQNTTSDNSLGRIYFSPTFGINNPYGASIAVNAIDVEGENSYGTKMIFATRTKGNTARNPNINMTLGKGAVGINVDPTATTSVSDAKLQVRGESNGKIAQFLNSSSSPVVTFLTNGNLGVGTEEPVDKVHVKGHIRASLEGDMGGVLQIENLSKTGENQMQRWRFANTTDTQPSEDGGYNDGLALWGYNKDSTKPSGPKLFISDSGNMIIGGSYAYVNNTPPNERLTVQGNARVEGLKGTGDRVVYADENGVLKTGGSIAANNGVQTQTTMECNEDNRGKMNFGRISINSKETDAIGFCMKNGDNQFRWYYIYGGASHTVGTNANFGQGL